MPPPMMISYRYKVDENNMVTDTSHPEKIVTGLNGQGHAQFQINSTG